MNLGPPARLALPPSREQRLEAALREARIFVADELILVLESECVAHPVTLEPMRETLSEDGKEVVAEIEGVLAQIDAALAMPT